MGKIAVQAKFDGDKACRGAQGSFSEAELDESANPGLLLFSGNQNTTLIQNWLQIHLLLSRATDHLVASEKLLQSPR